MTAGGFSEKNLPHQYYAMPKSLKTEDKFRQIRLLSQPQFLPQPVALVLSVGC